MYERREMDKKEVIKITLDLLKEKKLEKTSIGEIVKRVESSPGNLYYHFKNKNEIYEKTILYSRNEIMSYLSKVKLGKNEEQNLFILTTELIKFLELKEEILYFLMSMKASCYIQKGLDFSISLKVFKEVLLNVSGMKEENIKFKLRMFWGSICELLYVSRFIEKRYLTEKEIEDIYISYWAIRTEEKYKVYTQDYLNIEYLQNKDEVVFQYISSFLDKRINIM